MINRFKLVLEKVPYEIERRGDLLVVNGQELPWAQAANGAISIAGTPHAVELKGSTAMVDGISYGFEAQGLEEPKASKRKASAKAAEEAGAITAIMPGLIIKVCKQQGDKVEEGEVLFVLEAMKMQNELKAKGPGTLRQINVKAGETVEMRQVLAVVE